LFLSNKSDAALSVKISSPTSGQRILRGTTVVIVGQYTCDKDGCTLSCWVDGKQIGDSQPAQKGTNLYFNPYFKWLTWEKTPTGKHDITVGIFSTTLQCWGASNTVSVFVDGVQVTIKSPPTWILACAPYTGYPSNKATAQGSTSEGSTSGGTYQWSWSKRPGGTGGVSLSGTGNTVTIKGDTPSIPTLDSKQRQDVELKVRYTLNDDSAEDTCLLTVLAPYRTTCASTTQFCQSDLFKYYRDYYHQLKDQYNNIIGVEGILVVEGISSVEGAGGFGTSVITGNGKTTFLAFGAGSGLGDGYGVIDHLKCTRNVNWEKFNQVLTAGGWQTVPAYYVFFDISPVPPHYGSGWIWKQSH
jgi:hypothetical protein